MEKRLYGWKMPKVPANKIYYDHKGCFNFLSDHSIFNLEATIPLQSSNVMVKLLNHTSFVKALNSKTSRKQRKNLSNCYLHIGLVQIGVKPLSRQVANDTVLLGLRDSRYLDFKTSLLGLVESGLKDGPVYFNSYVNSIVPLSERNLMPALTANVMTKSADETVQGIEPLVLSYRVHCKIMSLPYGEKALKESPVGETLMYQAKVKSNDVVSRVIKWDDIQIPESWVKN